MPRVHSAHYHSHLPVRPVSVFTMTALPLPHSHQHRHHHHSAHQTPTKQHSQPTPPILTCLPTASSLPRRSAPSRRRRQTSQPAPSSNAISLKPAASPGSPPSLPPPQLPAATRPLRKLSPHLKQPRKSQAILLSRSLSPAPLHDDATQSDGNPSCRVQRRTSCIKPKSRSRAQSMSSPPPRQAEVNLTVPRSFPDGVPFVDHRLYTVTLNDHPTPFAYPSRSGTRNFAESMHLFHTSSKLPRSRKIAKSLAKRPGRGRGERPRTCVRSPADADIPPPLSSPSKLPVSSRHSRSSTPSPSPVQKTAAHAHSARDASAGLSYDDPVPAPRFSTLNLPASSQSRHHIRAKSAASILDLDKINITGLSRSVKSGWDMPHPGSSQDLTWQQLGQRLPKTLDLEIPTYDNSGRRLAVRDSALATTHNASPCPGVSAPKLVEASHGRRHRTALSRTSSASSVPSNALCPGSMISSGTKQPDVSEDQPLPSISAPPSPTPGRPSFFLVQADMSSKETTTPAHSPHAYHLPMGDDNSLTWQQAIMRSPPKNSTDFSTLGGALGSQPSCGYDHNKPMKSSHQADSITFKTPVKSMMLSSKKAGVPPAIKPLHITIGRRPPSKRRNSVSCGVTRLAQSPEDVGINPTTHLMMTNAPFPDMVPTTWTSFESTSTPAGVNETKSQKLAHRCSTPLPLTSSKSSYLVQNGNHTKPHTHQLITLSNRPTNQLNQTYSEPTPPVPATAPVSCAKENKVITPSKSRSTSELFQLLTPAGRPGNAIAGKGLMYAGPQFHNSPSPAALPAPKFAFGSS